MDICDSRGLKPAKIDTETLQTLFVQTAVYCYIDSLTKSLQCIKMSATACQITSVSVVCSIVGSGANQRKHQSSASLAFVWVIHRSPVNSPHKRPVTRKMYPFDDVIMYISRSYAGIVSEYSRLSICTKLGTRKRRMIPCNIDGLVVTHRSYCSLLNLWELSIMSLYIGRALLFC